MSERSAVEFKEVVARAAARAEELLAAAPEPAVAVEPPRRFGGWQEAAAVIGTFVPTDLEPLGDGDSCDELLANSVQSVLPNGEPGWTLSSIVRVDALRQLRESGRAKLAVERNRARPGDGMGLALQRYITGTAPPVDTHTELAEAVTVKQAREWLRSAGFEDLPAQATLRQRVDWLSLLEPFRHLAGSHFRGRADELAKLRRYTGVQPPGSMREAGRRLVDRVLSLHDRPPLLVHGPGGVGKSTLVAKFILEHAEALEEDRFPFAYLDCERPDVDASTPLTLLAEAVRQLGIAYPHAYESADEIRRGWLDLVQRDRAGARARAAAVRDFAILIERLGAADRPVLLVLDTFEDVQRRSEEQVGAIWELLERLQRAVTRLRVVIVGRAEIHGRNTQKLPLNELDREAAALYLQSRGITDPELAGRIARQFGGSPLSLKLVADLVEREGAESALEVGTDRLFGLRAKQEVIQRQLYVRILGHIPNAEVRKLAHPGLVLRRLTPELIVEVLAEPCGLAIRSRGEAERLFGELRREVSLVTVATDGALVHRSDLRRLILELLEADEPEKTRRIHSLAVAYYERRQPRPQERAEEIYHRLALGQDTKLIDKRWISGVEPYLATAMPEFTGSRRAWLAGRLELAVDEETRMAADLEDWERLTAPRVQQLLTVGKANDALSLMRRRSDRSPLSALPFLEAAALAQLGRWSEGTVLLEREVDRAIADGRQERALALALSHAQLARSSADAELCRTAADRLEQLQRTLSRPQDRLAVLARRVSLARVAVTPESQSRELLAQLREQFDSVADEALIAAPTLARWAAWAFEHEDVDRFGRVLRLIPLPRDDEGPLRSLASALASFDASRSDAMGRPPGVVAAEVGVEIVDSITESWGSFLREASEATVSDAIRFVLSQYRHALTPSVTGMLAEVLGAGLLLQGQAEADAADAIQTAPRRARSVPKPVLRGVARALIAAFPDVEELRSLLLYRLDISLYAIAPDSASYLDMAAAVVDEVAAQGRVAELVAAAREARPLNTELLRVGEELGLSTIVPADVGSVEAVVGSSSGINPAAWIERLAQIEGQVCRVEIGREAPRMGTGFLVGPEVVLTAEFVVANAAPSDVTVRFDYKTAADGVVVTPGTEFQVSELLASSAYSERPDALGYALLRVDGSPGAQPIGGIETETTVALRRWIEVPPSPPQVYAGAGLAIIQHPEGRPLRLSFSDKGVIGTSADGARLYHTLDTAPGSSGSPCFTLEFEPVAFQIGTSNADRGAPPNAKVAVLMSAVLADLRAKQLDHLMHHVFA